MVKIKQPTVNFLSHRALWIFWGQNLSWRPNASFSIMQPCMYMEVITGQSLLRAMNSCAQFCPLCTFKTNEIPISARLKNYLDQNNLTKVSFSAFAWDSRCLWHLLNYRRSSSSFLSLSYIQRPPSPPSSLPFSPALCFKWQFIPFVRSATLNINFLAEHTLRPNRRNKISPIYCTTPSSLLTSWHCYLPRAPSSRQPTSGNKRAATKQHQRHSTSS